MGQYLFVLFTRTESSFDLHPFRFVLVLAENDDSAGYFTSLDPFRPSETEQGLGFNSVRTAGIVPATLIHPSFRSRNDVFVAAIEIIFPRN